MTTWGSSHTVPTQDEGTWRGQTSGVSLREEAGSAASNTGADSQYWKSAEWVIFHTGLETAGPELSQAWAPATTASPEKSVRLQLQKQGTATTTEDALKTFLF